ncbi:MAG: glutamate--tRNA ligase, partial [Paracoccaceae bacterium]
LSTLFRSPWRDADPADHPDAPYVIRIKAPRSGETIVQDRVQGRVVWRNELLDDMICLRSDASPTYMLAVVVDDHDMGVTHVIRGDDHLANAARQMMVYDAMGWDVPVWAHISLIHGADGKKLSKRHGATGLAEYQKMGFAAAGMRNYLTRLGWSHGDDEFFSDDEARDWFDLDGIGKSPARFDVKKLEHISGRHIATSDDTALLDQIEQYLRTSDQEKLTATQKKGLLRAMYCLTDRVRTFPQLIEKAQFILKERPLDIDRKSQAALDTVSLGILNELTPALQDVSWKRDTLEAVLADYAAANNIKLGQIAQPLRAALAGRPVTPSVFDMMLVLGRGETLARLRDAQGHRR